MQRHHQRQYRQTAAIGDGFHHHPHLVSFHHHAGRRVRRVVVTRTNHAALFLLDLDLAALVLDVLDLAPKLVGRDRPS